RRSFANGACGTARLPTALKKQVTASSPSPGFHRASGRAPGQLTQSNVCMRSLSGASRPRLFCLRLIQPPCASRRYSLPGKPSCARLMDGKRWQQNQISRLTWLPDQITSPLPETAPKTIPTQVRTAPPVVTLDSAVRRASPIALATLAVALALGCVSAGFSIDGLTAIFAGAFWPVVAMGATLELGKLVATAWLRHNWCSSTWFLRLVLMGMI